MTSPGGYSAGTAFLDIVPSFHGVQRAIAKEVRQMEQALGAKAGEEFGKSFEKGAVKAVDKALGTTKDSAGKSGEDAAKAYAGRFADEFGKTMARVQRETKALKMDFQPIGFDKLKKDIEALSKVKIGKDMNAGPAIIELGRIEKKLRDIQDAAGDLQFRTNLGVIATEFEAFRKRVEKDAKFEVDLDMDKADRQLGLFEKALKKRIDGALSNIAPVEFDADVTQAQAKIMDLRRQLLDLRDKRIGIDIGGGDANGQVEQIRRQLAGLAGDKNIDFAARTDAAGAAAELTALRTLAELVDKTKVEIKADVNVDSAMARLHRLRDNIIGAGHDGEDSANAFRAFSFVILGVAAAGAAAIPVITALAGALALLGPLAVGGIAGLAVMGIGFSGISDAVKNLGKVEENAAKDAEDRAKRIEAAQRRVADATAAVADARQDAASTARDGARAVETAVEGVTNAEESLVAAQRDVVDAQRAVNDAREDASDRLRDLRLQLEGGALAERQAVLDLAEARAEYEKAKADPTLTAAEREQALIDLQREELGLRRIRVQNQDLREEQAKGVEGSAQVVAAQGRVRDAQGRVRDAVDGVADANDRVREAQLDAAEANAAASARIVAAQEDLVQAQADQRAAVEQTSTSVRNLEIAMGKLGPAGQAFAVFIHSLRDDLREMRDIVQEQMLPGVQTAISTILTKNGELIRDFLGKMGAAIGSVFIAFGDLMTTPQWQRIWSVFNEYAPVFFTQFAQIGGALFTALGELFVGLAPYAERMGDAMVRIAQAAAQWAENFVKSDTFMTMMEWLFTNGPVVFDAVWSIFRAFANLFVALEPLGMLLLGVIDNLADFIAWVDPDLLGAVVTAIIGLVVAFQLAAGAVAVVLGATAVLAGGLSLVVFAVGAVITGLIVLYTQSETFRNIIDFVFRSIGAVIAWWWQEVVFPVFGFFVDMLVKIGDAGVWLWKNVLVPVFEGIGVGWGLLVDGLKWAWDNILKPLWDVIAGAAEILLAIIVVGVLGPIMVAWKLLAWVFSEAYNRIIKPLWEDMVKVGQWLWEMMEPIFKWIGEKFSWLGDIFGSVWDWIVENVIDPWDRTFEGMAEDFGKIVNALGDAWDWLKEKLAAPINFVIKYVLNEGLFKAFNWIIETLSLPDDWKIDSRPYIKVDGKTPGLAMGGRVPGWSPHDKADNVPAMLTAGEWVQPVSTVDYYGPDVMEAIRKRRIPREQLAFYANGGPVMRGGVQHLAAGGMTWPTMWKEVKAALPYARLTSSLRPGDPGHHGTGHAIDVAGQVPYPSPLGRAQMLAINKWMAAHWGTGLQELIHTASGAINLYDGKPHQYGAATQADHYDHVHAAITSLANLVSGRSVAGGAMVTTLFESIGAVWNKLEAGLDKAGEVGNKFGSFLGKTLGGVGREALGFLWDKIKGPVAALWDGLTGVPEGPPVPPGTPSENRAIVQGVAALYGWNRGPQWDALQALVMQESSFNANAQNPTSTAYGMFQFLNSTWGATGIDKTSDPRMQTQAGLKYIRDRYGDPVSAWAFHRQNNWYSEGGEVGGKEGSRGHEAPTLYDSGGWLPPGITTVLNATQRPEPILTSAQWEAMTADRQGGNSALFGQVHVHQVKSDAAEVASELHHLARVYRRGGRYADVGSI